MLVPRSVFEMHRCCEPDASRFALGGIMFRRQPDGSPIAVSSNGRILVAATWEEDGADEYPQLNGCDPSPNGGTFQAVIPKKACQKAQKLPGAKSPKAILDRNVALDEHSETSEDSPYAVTLGATDLTTAETLTPLALLGRFPHYWDVFPTSASETSIMVDAKLLIEVLTTLMKTTGGKGAVLTFRGHKRVLTVSSQSGRLKAIGGVMPLVDKDDKPPEEGWKPSNPNAPKPEPAPKLSLMERVKAAREAAGS